VSKGRKLSDSAMIRVPRRRSTKDIVVLKFGGTTMGATPEQGRITLARKTMAGLFEEGKFVVPVFSAYRRGRSGSQEKFSVTDQLQNYDRIVKSADTLTQGVKLFCQALGDAHIALIRDLKIDAENALMREIEDEIETLGTSVALACAAFEKVPSLDDLIVTAGERLAVRVISAYLNDQHKKGDFPMPTAPVTALELGITTDAVFGNGTIDWSRAVDHTREVIIGQYVERGVMPVVTGFDGIYDPHDRFKDLMQTRSINDVDLFHTGIYRTSLGRGGSDLTATFLGMALEAEYVGFCKETPGVLTGDDMLVGKSARTLTELDYDLATEAGNIYGKAVEPVRARKVPVHIFDPAQPEPRTIVSDIDLGAGLYIVEHPMEAINVHAGTIPDEPGSLNDFLRLFSEQGVNVEEIRHQRSGTDCIVCGDEDDIMAVVDTMADQGLRPEAHYTWYLRVIGNVTEELAKQFNDFMLEFDPLTLATFQIGTKALTATVSRNRAGTQEEEMQRIEGLVQRIHNELIATNQGTG
jgi:aspartokinase